VPYVSSKQRKFFNANRDKIGGDVVDEWNEASRGVKDSDLPESVSSSSSDSESGSDGKKSSTVAWAKRRAASSSS
jgi:hypothetical protein